MHINKMTNATTIAFLPLKECAISSIVFPKSFIMPIKISSIIVKTNVLKIYINAFAESLKALLKI